MNRFAPIIPCRGCARLSQVERPTSRRNGETGRHDAFLLAGPPYVAVRNKSKSQHREPDQPVYNDLADSRNSGRAEKKLQHPDNDGEQLLLEPVNECRSAHVAELGSSQQSSELFPAVQDVLRRSLEPVEIVAQGLNPGPDSTRSYQVFFLLEFSDVPAQAFRGDIEILPIGMDSPARRHFPQN